MVVAIVVLAVIWAQLTILGGYDAATALPIASGHTSVLLVQEVQRAFRLR